MKSCKRSVHDLVQTYEKISWWRSCWHPVSLAWSCTGPCVEDIVQMLVKSFLRGACMTLYRPFNFTQKILWWSWSDPLWEVLAWKSCRCHVLEVLVWKLLWEAFGRFLYQDPLQQQQVLFMTILLKIVAKVFYKPLWEDLVEILVKSSKRSLQCMILYRSLWEDLVKILLTSSLRGPCIKTLEDDVHWWLYESSSGMLIASSCMKISKVLYLDGPSLTIFWISLRCPCMGFWYDE